MADEPKPTKGIGGRRLKLTPEVQEKIISAIKAGNYVKVACAYAGIAESTHHLWLQKGEADPESVYGEFLSAVRLAEAHSEVRAVALIQAAMPENWTAAMTYLERRFPERWRRHAATEHSGPAGGPINVREIVVELPQESHGG